MKTIIHCSLFLLLLSVGSLILENSSDRFQEFSNLCLNKQQRIIKELEQEEYNIKFLEDPWNKTNEEGPVTAYGITAVLQGGNTFEKAAVSTTISSGTLSEERAKVKHSRTFIN